MFNFAFAIRYISEMTPKEFEHKAKLMRAKALAVACKFLPKEEAEDVEDDENNGKSRTRLYYSPL